MLLMLAAISEQQKKYRQSKTSSVEEAERWKAPGEQCRPKDGLGGLAPRKKIQPFALRECLKIY